MIYFKEINEENFDAIISMSRPKEERFVAPNSYSLAQAWLYRNDQDVFPYAIYHDDDPVGFLLMEENKEDRELWIWRIMFPEEHANKGYGTEAIRLIIDKAGQRTDDFDDLCVDCAVENHRARHVYEKLGFQKSGMINHGDEEMRFSLRRKDSET